MVLLGGLEIVAAGYLIHKHNKNKKERARLEEEAAALEEDSYPLFPADQRPPRRHTHSHSQSQSRPHTHSSQSLAQVDESDEERRARRRRRREKRRKEEEEEFGYERTNSAPPKLTQTQTVVAPGVVAGWPAHWKQSQVPSAQPPRVHTPQTQMNARPRMNPPGPNGYPQDVKYGFVPDIPHDQYPPPYSGPSEQPDREERRQARREERREDRRGRERLEVRGRRERRSVSPMLGVYDDDNWSPDPRVRFSNENVVLGGSSNPPPKYRA